MFHLISWNYWWRNNP